MTLCLLALIMACNTAPSEQRRSEEESNYKVKISVSAGEMFSPFDSQSVPTFFNVGQLKSDVVYTELLVLGKRLSKGNTIAIDPVGLLKFQMDTLDLKYIIAVPESESNNSEEFLVRKYHLQNSMEEWFKAQGEFNECKNFNWGSPYKALLEIDGILNNN